jgi:hypothetical protein
MFRITPGDVNARPLQVDLLLNGTFNETIIMKKIPEYQVTQYCLSGLFESVPRTGL